MDDNPSENDSLAKSKFCMQISTGNQLNAGTDCKSMYVWLTDITGHTTVKIEVPIKHRLSRNKVANYRLCLADKIGCLNLLKFEKKVFV